MKDRSGREALALDWAMQHEILRLEDWSLAGETGDGLGCCKEPVASVSPLQRPCPVQKTWRAHRRLLIYLHTTRARRPQQKQRPGMTSIPLVTPARSGYNDRRTDSQSCCCTTVHLTLPPVSYKVADAEQSSEYCRDGVASRLARRAERLAGLARGGKVLAPS